MKQTIKFILSLIFMMCLAYPIVNAGSKPDSTTDKKEVSSAANSPTTEDSFGSNSSYAETGATSARNGDDISESKEDSLFSQTNINSLLIILIILVFGYYIIEKQKQKRSALNRLKRETNAEKIEALEFDIEALKIEIKSNYKDVNNRIKDCHNDIKDVNDKLLMEINSQKNDNQLIDTTQSTEIPTKTSNIEGYFGINKGTLFNDFRSDKADQSFFRVNYDPNLKEGTFSLIDLGRIKSISDKLSDSISLTHDNNITFAKANTFSEVSPGKVKKEDGQNWRIESKLIIKLTD